jgi:hypothetical protein
MYTIRVNTYAKIFSVVMKGTLTTTEGRSFAAEFQNEVKNIEPSDYALLIDTQELDIVPGGECGVAERMCGMTMTTPFKACYSFSPIRLADD